MFFHTMDIGYQVLKVLLLKFIKHLTTCLSLIISIL